MLVECCCAPAQGPRWSSAVWVEIATTPPAHMSISMACSSNSQAAVCAQVGKTTTVQQSRTPLTRIPCLTRRRGRVLVECCCAPAERPNWVECCLCGDRPPAQMSPPKDQTCACVGGYDDGSAATKGEACGAPIISCFTFRRGRLSPRTSGDAKSNTGVARRVELATPGRILSARNAPRPIVDSEWCVPQTRTLAVCTGGENDDGSAVTHASYRSPLPHAQEGSSAGQVLLRAG